MGFFYYSWAVHIESNIQMKKKKEEKDHKLIEKENNVLGEEN